MKTRLDELYSLGTPEDMKLIKVRLPLIRQSLDHAGVVLPGVEDLTEQVCAGVLGAHPHGELRPSGRDVLVYLLSCGADGSGPFVGRGRLRYETFLHRDRVGGEEESDAPLVLVGETKKDATVGDKSGSTQPSLPTVDDAELRSEFPKRARCAALRLLVRLEGAPHRHHERARDTHEAVARRPVLRSDRRAGSRKLGDGPGERRLLHQRLSERGHHLER